MQAVGDAGMLGTAVPPGTGADNESWELMKLSMIRILVLS